MRYTQSWGRTMLKIWQVGALVLLGVVLWVLVTINIRLMPNSFTDPLLGAIAFLLALPAGWVSVWLTKVVGRLSWDQLLPGVSVVAAVAMMMDGAALHWFSTIYSLNETTVRLGAAWLLWGYGVALGVAVVMAARARRNMA
jgi:hypothetical protein